MSYLESVERSLPIGRMADAFRLEVVWWNTGIHALAKRFARLKCSSDSSDSPSQKQLNEIARELQDRNRIAVKLLEFADILVLGEYVDEYQLRQKLQVLNYDYSHRGIDRRYDMIDLHHIVGSMLEFDNVVIYNSKKLYCVPQSIIERTVSNVGTRRKGQNYKAFQTVKFDRLHGSDLKFDLHVVHWNMRDGFGGDAKYYAKLKAAEILAKRVASNDRRPYKIVVGDFNNEPYEESLVWLEGSRSRQYVSRNGGLYNPFWNFLGQDKYTINSPDNPDFLSDGAIFDGIMVNQQFLSDNYRWDLVPEIIEGLYEPSLHDHNPIRLKIER